jgi:hypothetical protein
VQILVISSGDRLVTLATNNIRAFHDEVLGAGAPPMDLLEPDPRLDRAHQDRAPMPAWSGAEPDVVSLATARARSGGWLAAIAADASTGADAPRWRAERIPRIIHGPDA